MRRRHAFVSPLLALTLAAVAGSARADEVRTRSGTVYEGRLVNETGTHYVLETRDLGTLRIAKADVVEVRGPGRESPKPPAAEQGPAAPKPAAGEKPAAGGDGPKAADGKSGDAPPADPAEAAAQARARAEAERRAAEEAAALDAAQRMERRRATKIRRRTDPIPSAAAPASGPPAAGAPEPPPAGPAAPPSPGTPATKAPTASAGSEPAATGPAGAPPRDGPVLRKVPSGATPAVGATPLPSDPESDDRPVLGGALLANVAPGTEVVLFEPPRKFEAAPGGIELGRRTFARLDAVGTASAWLEATIAGKPERLPVRLVDVQRHVEVKSPKHRVRMLEGVAQGDWVRLTLDDGAIVEGRLSGLDGTTVTLSAPTEDGATVDRTADMTRAVRLEGLLRNASAQKSLSETELDEPIALTTWPDGRMYVGRVVGHGTGTVRLDLDGDRAADAVIPLAAPLAEVRRIPGAAREKIREIKTGELVRVRGYEEYPDARIERSWTGPVESVTAFAICLRLDDGAAVVPFDSLVSLDKVLADLYRNQGPHAVPVEQAGLRVLPGMPPEEAGSAPPGVSALNDGREVTHVYVAPPFEGSVFGVRVGCGVTEALSETDLEFTTEVLPKQDARGVRPKEMISESVDGLRVVVFVTPRDVVSAVEISRR